MGQYYLAVLEMEKGKPIVQNNYTKENSKSEKQYTYLKLLEHSWWKNPYVTGIAKRIYNKIGRIAWVGDYAEYITDEIKSYDNEVCKLSTSEVWQGKNKKTKPFVMSPKNFTLNNTVFINHSRKEFIDLEKYFNLSVSDDGWCINPVSLMTGIGNNQGGGDYYDKYVNFEYVGRWCYDLLEIKNKDIFISNGYKEIEVYFNDEVIA